jgi:hypothetical protein
MNDIGAHADSGRRVLTNPGRLYRIAAGEIALVLGRDAFDAKKGLDATGVVLQQDRKKWEIAGRVAPEVVAGFELGEDLREMASFQESRGREPWCYQKRQESPVPAQRGDAGHSDGHGGPLRRRAGRRRRRRG